MGKTLFTLNVDQGGGLEQETLAMVTVRERLHGSNQYSQAIASAITAEPPMTGFEGQCRVMPARKAAIRAKYRRSWTAGLG